MKTKQKHYLSAYQMIAIAGRLQDFAKEQKVEWESVCPAVIAKVKER